MIRQFGIKAPFGIPIMQKPPLPHGIAIHDRADNTLWLVSHTQTPGGPDGEGYISIMDTWPDTVTPTEYPAFGEPYISNFPEAKLIIRGGYLGIDIIELPRGVVDIDSGPIYTRKGVQRRTAFIFKPDAFVELGQVLAWTPEVITA